MLIGAGGSVDLEEGIAGEHILYNGEVRIKFDPIPHAYTVQDLAIDEEWRAVPSVTTILGAMLDKSKYLAPWAAPCGANRFRELILPGRAYADDEIEVIAEIIRRAHKDALTRAGDIGGQAHKWIEQYILARGGRGAYPAPPQDEQVRNCCRAAKEWIKSVDVRPLEEGVERVLYSRKNGVVGTTDLAGMLVIGGRSACCDWKSSAGIRDTYRLQLGAYQAMWEEMTGVLLDDRVIIRLDKNGGGCEPVVLPAEEADQDAKAFFGLADAYRLLATAGFIENRQ